MTKKRLFFIGIAGLILVFLWPLLNNFIPLIKEWINAKHDQAFLREVFKQANFQNALILISLMILSSAIQVLFFVFLLGYSMALCLRFR